MNWKPITLPAWLTIASHDSKPSVLSIFTPKLTSAKPPQPQQPPTMLIYVDPALVVAEPPANAKYYSTANTAAANPEIKVQAEKPNLSGTQEQVVKTVVNAPRTPAPQPELQPALQPTPAENKKPETAKTGTEKPDTGDNRPLPKPSTTPGNMAEARPTPKTQTTQGTANSDSGSGSASEPAHPRPRTLTEAREQSGAPGPKMKQDGGVNRLAMTESVDAVKTVYGDYDREFIDAVQSRWDALLKNREDDVVGKVVLEFNLHADGRISDMKREYSDVNELLSLICQQAVLDPALYKPWPTQMIAVIKDPRPIRFTFYYSY